MAAYVIVEVAINDPEGYAEYRKLSTAAVEAYGGKFLARGGRSVALEGDWNPERVVILEFESVERAQEWWSSPEYTAAKEIRHRTASSKMLIVEGYQP